jgi:hypothetical protein
MDTVEFWMLVQVMSVGTGAVSPGVKQQGREPNHSPPARVKVNGWRFTSASFMYSCPGAYIALLERDPE